MSVRFQRLLIILFSLILTAGELILILNNSKKNIVFFYTPSELIEAGNKINQQVRIGGFVKENSINRISTPNEHITFIVTDNENDIFVEYNGILPDMFREKQGTVIEGTLIKRNTIKAQKVFAKHDENYMPASIKKQLETSNYWKKNYFSNTFEQIPKFTSESLTNKKNIITNNDVFIFTDIAANNTIWIITNNDNNSIVWLTSTLQTLTFLNTFHPKGLYSLLAFAA